MAQRHKLGIVEIGLLVVGAAIAVAMARPAEAALFRFSSAEALVGLGLVVAVLLFVLRRHRKDIYGAMEVVVGFFTLAVAGDALAAHTVPTAIIGFFTAVYVLVRGMTHFVEGRNERAAA